MFDWLNLETLAVVLAVAYLVLAIKENSLCWYCAFFSTAIYVWIFGDVSLYMESALNIYYMAMAVYGWYQWQRGGEQNSGLSISRWKLKQHSSAILLIAIATAVSGYLLDTNTDARLPYLDSFTTWAAVLTTVMVARKVIDNWLYWMVINSASIYLFWDRELYQTAALLVLYIALSVIGYRSWLKGLQQQNLAAKSLVDEVQLSAYATVSANSR
ncbi:transporter, putative [gamma proteobacterium HTCC2207]|uniref:Nicotinamide riboside transporter PnuC n=1 Tax=gamma proteobacterium HTCC2207 TaxID=314287 RepID=Q1YRJ3_9GAMM|nr:transporter, putative [gamma proteobacterium HTCC2207]